MNAQIVSYFIGRHNRAKRGSVAGLHAFCGTSLISASVVGFEIASGRIWILAREVQCLRRFAQIAFMRSACAARYSRVRCDSYTERLERLAGLLDSAASALSM